MDAGDDLEPGPPAAGGLSRRQVLAGLGSAAAASGLAAATAQGAARTGRSRAVAAPSAGRTATEFVGRIDQQGGSFVAYGFLTFVDGVPRQQLFSALGDPRSESAARFTFYATASLMQRSVIDERLFVLDVTGTLEHFFSAAPSATFADPASFRRGRRLARSSFRFQNALSTIAPNEGIPVLEGPVTQLSPAASFALGAGPLRFGRRGMRTHISATGRATRTEPIAPRVALSIAGSAIVVG